MTSIADDAILSLEELTKQTESLAKITDFIWVFLGIALVFIMQAGFALLEVGSISTHEERELLQNTALKNISGPDMILLKNGFDVAIAAVLWACTGFAAAFGNRCDEDPNPFIGTYGYFLYKVGQDDCLSDADFVFR